MIFFAYTSFSVFFCVFCGKCLLCIQRSKLLNRYLLPLSKGAPVGEDTEEHSGMNLFFPPALCIKIISAHRLHCFIIVFCIG